jgi:hypothetical protein
VYANAFGNDEYLDHGSQNTVHELGHAFGQRTGWDQDAQNWRAYAHLEDTWDAWNARGQNFPQRPATPRTQEGGFAGTYLGWQQSTVATSNEVFADMFLGFTYNNWSTTDPAGAILSGWMGANVPRLMPLAVAGN